ncbi:hypothetical protein B0X71_04740 [Planococcus lenghuensis]|uniref:Uncharacterized protein n=2 Tax=Planococcus lenghuensis TaxID=2213202 RepID=A0A1Q2KWF8_9BACL|nr:hypothetical protein B0X71_04740 [Planococcus lenghuensis]
MKERFRKHRIDGWQDQNRLIHLKWTLGLKAVLSSQIRSLKKDALSKEYIDAVIAQALQEAAQQIKGKGITPFLFGKIKDLTDGKSLEINSASVKHNAHISAQLAVLYAQQ